LFLLHHYTTKTQNTFIYYFLLNPLTNTLIVNFFYIERYYNWSPPLGSHQDTFLALLLGNSALLVSWFCKETAFIIYYSDYFYVRLLSFHKDLLDNSSGGVLLVEELMMHRDCLIW
jgi:hypothetical protein